eukprot:386876_1
MAPPPPVTDQEVADQYTEDLEFEKQRLKNKQNKRALSVNRKFIKNQRRTSEKQDPLLRSGKCRFPSSNGSVCENNHTKKSMFCSKKGH